ncbi:MAG: hypothetical protein ABIE36_03260 [Candidatus Diapherotrites archaeon]
MKKKKSFEEHSCDLKNEAECEEELEDGGASLEDAEEEMFGEE